MPHYMALRIWDDDPTQMSTLEGMLRHRTHFKSEEEMLEKNGGWRLDYDNHRVPYIGTDKHRIVFLVRYSDEELAAMDEAEEKSIEDSADIRQLDPEKDIMLVGELKKKGYVYTNKWKGLVELTLWMDVAKANQEYEAEMAAAEGEAEAQAEMEAIEERRRDEEARMEYEEGRGPEEPPE